MLNSNPKFESYKNIKVSPSMAETQMPKTYLEAGLSYRGMPLLKRYRAGYLNQDAVILLLGVCYYDLKVAYTFDVTISALGLRNSGGAHEISLEYRFLIPYSAKKKRPTRGLLD